MLLNDVVDFRSWIYFKSISAFKWTFSISNEMERIWFQERVRYFVRMSGWKIRGRWRPHVGLEIWPHSFFSFCLYLNLGRYTYYVHHAPKVSMFITLTSNANSKTLSKVMPSLIVLATPPGPSHILFQILDS